MRDHRAFWARDWRHVLKGILEPASSAVPAATEKEHHDYDDDQQRRVVHAESSLGKRPPIQGVASIRFD
jgi:hypothetical protein